MDTTRVTNSSTAGNRHASRQVDDGNHPLALKVMRLSKPAMRCESPLLGIDCIPSMLVLPESGANVYLGQMFSSYICVSNESVVHVGNVRLSAELQTPNRTIHLRDKREKKASATRQPQELVDQINFSPSLSPDEGTLVLAVEQELADIGVHQLRVRVEYDSNIPSESRKCLNKFYRFEVVTPLSFAYKVREIPTYDPELNGCVLAQIEIKNLTTENMLFHGIRFLPFDTKKVRATVLDQNPAPDGNTEISELPPLLTPGSSYNVVAQIDCLQDSTILESKQSLGRVLINWRSGMGDNGRIVSQRIFWEPNENIPQVRVLRSNIRARVFLDPTEKVRIGKMFGLICVIRNESDSPVDICLNIESLSNDSMKPYGELKYTDNDPLGRQNMLICGPMRNVLGRLEPNCSLKYDLKAIPVRTGFFDVDNIFIKDLNTGAQCRATGNLQDDTPLRIFVGSETTAEFDTARG